ncbi:uncharacterized protein LOC124909776 [Impatiens glandulifera]|uniref:uncharacterized protein LOC124909776 n=1 Tax=Impatiens glandulifera TaxID=253017 RepID=UPI001FB1131F|nr:uncharacterized protein LOC124909776 [Impatiens glandulifera]
MELIMVKKSRTWVNHIDAGFTKFLFSLSLDNIFNEDLYTDQVVDIPASFESVNQYYGSFVHPLQEDIRAKLCSCLDDISKAPFEEVSSCNVSSNLGKNFRLSEDVLNDESQSVEVFIHDIKVGEWSKNDHGKETYKPMSGDLVLFSNYKPESVSDLNRKGRTWILALVRFVYDDEEKNSSTHFNVMASKDKENNSSTHFNVMASKEIGVEDLYMVFLINVLTEKRVWHSLHSCSNAEIIKKVIETDDSEALEDCRYCDPMNSLQLSAMWNDSLLSQLNKSQRDAVMSSLIRTNCSHKPSIDLIWGPPGTGKTKTISLLLFKLLSMQCSTLVCTPTNVAIKEIASRTLKLVKQDSFDDAFLLPLGDLLLLGNNNRLKARDDLELKEIYLDFRVEQLTMLLSPLSGWRHSLISMSDFFTDCVSQYEIYFDNELIKEKAKEKEKENENGKEKGKEKEKKKAKEKAKEKEVSEENILSFLEFSRNRFNLVSSSLRSCIPLLFVHLPRHFINEPKKLEMIILFDLLDQLGKQLFNENVSSEELKKIFLRSDEICRDSDEALSSPLHTVRKTLSSLKDLQAFLHNLNLPNVKVKDSVKQFCIKSASLVFCTASTSYNLRFPHVRDFKVLVIDEASQLKECESTIPLQLPQVMHAILVGDERQLPAMVTSKVSERAGFGRSLFERLSLMGHSKHLLNMQYRMHPSISLFPNSKFYSNMILDASNVVKQDYERRYLTAPMFGPYSFINIRNGLEEREDDGRSLRNMVEVAVVIKIIRNLYKAWCDSKTRLSIGIISPYAAQVAAIRDKLPSDYKDLDGFKVKVMSIDGFQGGEEDIIVISTVRSNAGGYVGFMSSHQRNNVALTRARHCLWILGSEKTLENSETIWASLVRDAKQRQCFFNADDQKDIEKTILDVKKQLDQWNDLLNDDSIYFKDAQWKVLFSENFKKSLFKLSSTRKKKSVMTLLLSLSSGWRPKSKNVDLVCQNSSHILKQFRVEGLFLVCSIDIKKEEMYIQVLKIWDVLPCDEVPKLVKRLEGLFAMYTDEYISHCKEKFLQGYVLLHFHCLG